MISLFLILATTVTAIEVKKTEFVVTTNPDSKLSISVVDPDLNNEEVELYEGVSKKSGAYRFTYHGIIDKVKLIVRIVNNNTGEIIDEKEFGPYSLGTTLVNVNFTSSKVESNEQVPEQTTELTESETSAPTSELTGLAVSETSLNFSSVYYYVIGGVLALVILVIVMRKRMSLGRSSPSEPHPNKVMKASKAVQAKKEVVVPVVDKSNESINDTEKRIVELQKQLDQVRNEEKLAKLQKQLNLEKQSLKRLQDESDDKPQMQNNNNLDNQNKPF